MIALSLSTGLLERPQRAEDDWCNAKICHPLFDRSAMSCDRTASLDKELHAIIDLIYASALEPALWPQALSRISSALGAVAATIALPGDPNGLLFGAGHEDQLADYVESWRDLDIIRAAVEQSDEGLYCDWEMFPTAIIDNSPFYQDFRRRHGVRHIIGRTGPHGINGRKLRFAIQLPLAKQPQEGRYIEEFDMIARHVCRAFDVSHKLTFERSLKNVFGDWIMRSPHATAVLDDKAKVVLANRNFAILASDGLAISDGKLSCARSRDQSALDDVIFSALSSKVGRRMALVSRPSRRLPLVVGAMPLARRHIDTALDDGLSSCRAVIVVLDLDEEGGTSADENLRVLGLTAAECRIAALVGRGLSPRVVASRLGLTESTVRTRIKGMFAKLEISRQSEIAHIVTKFQMFDTYLER